MNLGNWQTFTDRHIKTVRNLSCLKSFPSLVHASDLLAVAIDAICYAVQEAKTEADKASLQAMLKQLRAESQRLSELQSEAIKALD